MVVLRLPPWSLTEEIWSSNQIFGSCRPSNFGFSDGSLNPLGIHFCLMALLKHLAPESYTSSYSESVDQARRALDLSILHCVMSSGAS